MKKLTILLLCFLLNLPLLGCQEHTAPTTEATTIATVPVTEAAELVWTGYTGPRDEYIFYYTEGRDRQWEEDVLFFINSQLVLIQLYQQFNYCTTKNFLPCMFLSNVCLP